MFYMFDYLLIPLKLYKLFKSFYFCFYLCYILFRVLTKFIYCLNSEYIHLLLYLLLLLVC